jgi:hypothetical protein
MINLITYHERVTKLLLIIQQIITINLTGHC